VCGRKYPSLNFASFIPITATTHLSKTKNKHPFNDLFSRTTWVRRHHRMVKPIWILMKQEMMEDGVAVAAA